jgi:hypothetical protein
MANISIHSGVPTLFVDGKPMPPMYIKGWLGKPMMEKFASAGIHLHFDDVYDYPELKFAYTYENIDDYMEALLDADPKAYTMFRVLLRSRREFPAEYPDECLTFNDGSISHYDKPWKAYLDDGRIGRYSFASKVWRGEAEETVMSVIEHINQSPYSERVIAYLPSGGAEHQWIYWWDYDKERHTIDFSRAMAVSFKEYLISRYVDEDALKQAWQDDNVTFATVEIPTLEERRAYDIGYFYNPAVKQKVIDYYRCHNRVMADKVIHLAGVVKRVTDNKALVGAYYGPICSVYGLPTGGYAEYESVLACPSIDFFCRPYNYENRGVGDSIVFPFLEGSLKLHNKLWIGEVDSRTINAPDNNLIYGKPDNIHDSLAVQWRDFSKILTSGVSGYWYGFTHSEWFDHPDILKAMARMQYIAQKSTGFDLSSNREIACFISEDGLFCCEQEHTSFNSVEREQIYELPRVGSEPEYFDLKDITKLNTCDYKVFIFLNSFYLDSALRSDLEKYLKKDGNILIWIYAPGVINPDSKAPFGVDHMKDLTGFSMGYSIDYERLEMEIINNDHPIVSDINVGYKFGNFTRPVTTGWFVKPDEPVMLASVTASPQFYVDDPEAMPLALFIDSGKVGMAVKDFGEWCSVYIGTTAVPAAILRAIAGYAGVHLYLDTDDIVYHNKSYLSIHTKGAGIRNVRLPLHTGVYDLIEDKVVNRDASGFEFWSSGKETKLFFVGNIDESLMND